MDWNYRPKTDISPLPFAQTFYKLRPLSKVVAWLEVRVEMMTTIAEMTSETTYVRGPAPADLPVDMIENDGQGQAWLNLSSEWLRIVAIKNLWSIDEPATGSQPSIRMHFRAIIEDGQRLALFQDLLDGAWYQQAASEGHA